LKLLTSSSLVIEASGISAPMPLMMTRFILLLVLLALLPRFRAPTRNPSASRSREAVYASLGGLQRRGASIATIGFAEMWRATGAMRSFVHEDGIVSPATSFCESVTVDKNAMFLFCSSRRICR
jgi:hypothetical protein